MEKRSHITAPLNIKFREKSMLPLYEEGIKKEIPYTEPIVVYLAAKNIGTGEIYMPGITEITADMDGAWTMNCIHIRHIRQQGNYLLSWRPMPDRDYLVMSRGSKRSGKSFLKRQKI